MKKRMVAVGDTRLCLRLLSCLRVCFALLFSCFIVVVRCCTLFFVVFRGRAWFCVYSVRRRCLSPISMFISALYLP